MVHYQWHLPHHLSVLPPLSRVQLAVHALAVHHVNSRFGVEARHIGIIIRGWIGIIIRWCIGVIIGESAICNQRRALGQDVEMFNLRLWYVSDLGIAHYNVPLTSTSFPETPADSGMGMVNFSWCSDIGVITFFLILVRMDLKSLPSPSSDSHPALLQHTMVHYRFLDSAL